MDTPYEPSDKELYLTLSEGEVCFNEELMLAKLLIDGVCFLNDFKYAFHGQSELAGQTVNVFVNCNDTFAYACADAEDLPLDELPKLFELYRKYGYDGVIRWCALRRGLQPLTEIVKLMKKEGTWDLELEALEPYKSGGRGR